MLAAALGSYFSTRKPVHEANHFNFHPIREVAILFIGIFATMMPALGYLEQHGQEFVGICQDETDEVYKLYIKKVH